MKIDWLKWNMKPGKERFLLYLFCSSIFPGTKQGLDRKKWYPSKDFWGCYWIFEGLWGHQLLYGDGEIPFDSKFREYFWLLIVNWRMRILLRFGGFFPACYYLQANPDNDVASLVIDLLVFVLRPTIKQATFKYISQATPFRSASDNYYIWHDSSDPFIIHLVSGN